MSYWSRAYVVARWRHSAAIVAHVIFSCCCRLKLNGSQARSIPINFTYTTKCIFLLRLLVASQPVGHCKRSNRFSVVFGLNAQPSILCLSILVFGFLTFFKRRSFALRLECLKAVTPTISVDTQENGGRSLFTNFCPYDIISLVLIDARRKKQQQPSSFIRFYSLLWIETKE